jgi:hypothetical protein
MKKFEKELASKSKWKNIYSMLILSFDM